MSSVKVYNFNLFRKFQPLNRLLEQSLLNLKDLKLFFLITLTDLTDLSHCWFVDDLPIDIALGKTESGDREIAVHLFSIILVKATNHRSKMYNGPG